MTDSRVEDPRTDDEYDEDADSDFDAGDLNDGDGNGNISSSSDEQNEENEGATQRPKKRRKVGKTAQAKEAILDSGDEATIKEHKKTRRKQQRKGEGVEDESDDGEQGWRAKTRAMRDKEKDERKRTKLASSKGSAIDVDRLWEEMNRPSNAVQPVSDNLSDITGSQEPLEADIPQPGAHLSSKNRDLHDQKNRSGVVAEEVVTIKRTYKFAGEVHTEEKTVPRSSAEARLWLSQQSSKPQATPPDGRVVRRPLRRISRFDPNYNNPEAFKNNWGTGSLSNGKFNGKKINTVEKSKMDWVAHVDAEGLKDELDEHAKSKEGYHSRKEFLDQVEQTREEEARQARLRG